MGRSSSQFHGLRSLLAAGGSPAGGGILRWGHLGHRSSESLSGSGQPKLGSGWGSGGSSQVAADGWAGSAATGTSITVGSPEPSAVFSAGPRSPGRLHAQALGAHGPGHRGEVGRVRRAIRRVAERGGQLAVRAEVAALLVADGDEAAVVPDQPDGRDAVLHRGGHHAGQHQEPAVADHGHDRGVRGGQPGAQHPGHAEAHGRETPALQQRAGPARHPFLDDPVVVRAHVADSRMPSSGSAARRSASTRCGPQRGGVRVPLGGGVPLPVLGPAAMSASQPRGIGRLAQGGPQLAQHVPGIGHHAQRDRVVPAQLGRDRRPPGPAGTAGSSTCSRAARNWWTGHRTGCRRPGSGRRCAPPGWPGNCRSARSPPGAAATADRTPPCPAVR